MFLSKIQEFTGLIIPSGSFVATVINDNGNFYLRKVSPALLGATGPQGPAGAAGATFLYGSGAPAAANGNNGDYYLDQGNGNLYAKASGAWTLTTNLRGPTGLTGATGAQGIQGLPGADGADAVPAGASGNLQFNDGGAPAALAADSKLTWDDTNDELHVDGNIRLGVKTETYGANITIDFREEAFRSLTLTGDVTFASSNLAAGRAVSLKITDDGSARALNFPATWVFLGTKPTNMTASKTGVLSLTAFSTTDASVIAVWAEEA